MKYRTIVADPPWQTTTGPRWIKTGIGDTIDGGHRPLPYDTMPLAEIKALPVADLAEPAAHLYLWTTNILVREAYGVVEAWGFKPSVILTWCKTPMGMGLGDAWGLTTEHVIFGHRGGLRPLSRAPSTWFSGPRGKHSAKPEAFIDLVEQVSPGPYLELFARRVRLGWDGWGNEWYEHAAVNL